MDGLHPRKTKLHPCGTTPHTPMARPCTEPQTANSANVSTSPLCTRARTQSKSTYHKKLCWVWRCFLEKSVISHQSLPKFPPLEHGDMPHKLGPALMEQARGSQGLPPHSGMLNSQGTGGGVLGSPLLSYFPLVDFS